MKDGGGGGSIKKTKETDDFLFSTGAGVTNSAKVSSCNKWYKDYHTGP